ncbi:hypothetical protein Sango_2329500 [Sesamum angolense]|uniref:Retrotransposon gag domain-containing protein n=1 Tax=Sesamum angolense TaxID=2727404 RepID=A0AAE1WAS0_9LAMI|nr:hypothetical protein Sango_2329500 [Sesamum angolense]
MPLKREGAQREKKGQGNPLPRSPSPMRAKGFPVRPLAVEPPRRNPFAPHILVEAIQPGIKIPNLNISDATYCKLFRTALSEKAIAWFNQLPPRTVEAFEQLLQRFLNHFVIKIRYPKTLFTIVQREREGLREYVQRFSEALLEVPHVDSGLLASIMQQNLRSNRFKESMSRKPPATRDELLARVKKYIRIEETAGTRPMTPIKRRSTKEEEVMPSKAERGKRERKHMPPNNLTHYSSLSVPRAEILMIAK